MAPGNREQLDRKFLAWIWNYPKTRRPRILERLGRLPASTAVVRLTSRRAVRLWLAGLAPAEAVAA